MITDIKRFLKGLIRRAVEKKFNGVLLALIDLCFSLAIIVITWIFFLYERLSL